MKARPLLFSSPMVRALLAGAKSQTRRLSKGFEQRDVANAFRSWGLKHGDTFYLWPNARDQVLARCPYGVAGDLLYVRETWQRVWERRDGQRFTEPPRNGSHQRSWIEYAATSEEPPPTWRSPLHLPRAWSRITLRITEVRIERLQDITSDDCIAEGIDPSDVGDAREEAAFNRDAYAELWESINGKGSWAANSWVWVIAFDVIKANVDKVLKEAA